MLNGHVLVLVDSVEHCGLTRYNRSVVYEFVQYLFYNMDRHFLQHGLDLVYVVIEFELQERLLSVFECRFSPRTACIAARVIKNRVLHIIK